MTLALRFAIFISVVASATQAAALERKPWNKPQLRQTSGGTEIRIETPPAGLLLQEGLDPTKRYELKVRGNGGPMAMRIGIDKLPPTYAPAPNGESVRVISGASLVELLFYSDTPASYVLQDIEISECSTCRTVGDLRQRIIAEAPEVLTTSGIDRALVLLKWAANISDYTPNPRLIPGDFESWPLEKMVYGFFDLDRGGVACGGSSVFFHKLLQLFDIDSLTVNYGVKGGYATHVTVVVQHEGRYYIVDPTFAITLVDGGRMVPVDELLLSLASGKTSHISIHEHGIGQRDIIGFTRDLSPEIYAACLEPTATADGLPKCRISESYLAIYLIAQAYSFESAGLPATPLSLFRLMESGVFGVGPSANSQVRSQFMALLAKHGISMH